MAQKKKQDSLLFIILILAAGTVYKVPYLKAVFYDQMLESLQITHTQMGVLSSIYAGVKMIIYIPCGIVADRIDAKKSLIVSLIGESILTAVYAAIPEFPVLGMIQAAMALVNVFFWTSFIKSIRILGKHHEQGKIFGLSEGFRGITGSAATLAALQVVAYFAQSAHPIRYVLLFYAGYYFVVGVLIWKFYPDHLEDEDDHRQTWRDYVEVFKKPAIWMVSLLIFTTYSMQVAFEYTTAYMTQVIGISAAAVGLIATLRDNVCGIVGSPFAGMLADRMHSPTKVAFRLIIIEIILCIILFVSPESPKMAYPIMGFILVFSVVLYGIRGVYYSTMSESGIPVSLTATATAAVAVFGYTPDMFMSLWCGRILDQDGYMVGFKKIFALMILFAFLAFVVCGIMRRYQRRMEKKHCDSEMDCIPGKIAGSFLELNTHKGDLKNEYKSKKMAGVYHFNAGCGADLQGSLFEDRIL